MKRELPRDTRFTISRRGELSYKGTRFPCLIQDVSAKGFFIISVRKPVVGLELGLRFELTPGHFHECRIRLKHIDDGCFGAETIEVGEQEDEVFQQFIRQQLTASQYTSTRQPGARQGGAGT